MKNLLLDLLQVNSIVNVSDAMSYSICKGTNLIIENLSVWQFLEYCESIGTLPNYRLLDSLVKYHQDLNQDQNGERRNDPQIHQKRKHYFGIEFSFETRRWFWNTQEEVKDLFWLQSHNGFINFAEPQLRDKLIYTMIEQNATDPSVESFQDWSAFNIISKSGNFLQ